MANVKATASGQSVVATDGDDVLTGIEGGATLFGGDGNDTYYIMSKDDIVVEKASQGIDTIISWRTSYTLSAHVENLSVLGQNLVGIGNNLANILTGGNGHQTLFGAAGNDTLTGGSGSDTFIVTPGSGSDTITDFETVDIAKIGSYGFKTFAEVTAKMTTQGSSTILELGNGETLTFLNKSIAEFSESNFQYALDTSNLQLTLAEEFNSLRLQGEGGIWRTSYHDGAGGNTHDMHAERQIYVDASYKDLGVNPFSTKDGVLTIHAEKASAAAQAETGYDYTSGMLSSRGMFSQTYGYFEIRAEVPAQTGTWPAFWLLPASGKALVELDVFEQIGNDASTAYMTAHSGIGGERITTGISSWIGESSGGMHTYGVLWTATDLVWYVDGIEAFRMPTPADMHEPMVLVTNLAIGGDWPGDPDASFVGADYKIDYIRAYQVDEHADTDNIMTGGDWSLTLDSVAKGLVLTGKLNINGTGNALDNTLVGNSGNNILDGRAGADIMTGGAGDDTYFVDDIGDTVIEMANGGNDTVRSSISYTLGAYVENLILTGNAAINGTGNALDNRITGNSGNNILDGGAGADRLDGGTGDDTYIVDDIGDTVIEWSNGGNDTVRASISYTLGSQVENLVLTGTGDINATGNGMDNVLTGNSGNNILNGGMGADIMIGGAGDDIYYVDNAGDIVTEWSNGGSDTVYSSISYTLGANVENLVYTGQWSSTLNGNSLDNRITGNGAANTIDGGAGADTMIGGAGNDTYIVDNAGDVIIELANEGTDTVRASASYILGANIENLVLTGAADVNGTGNALNNVLTGNSGNNLLDGGAGADRMDGGTGDDTYIVDNAGDSVIEWSNGGNDTVRASISYTLGSQVENLTLTGTANINATGNWWENILIGNSGNNIIDGGSGADRMTGGAGDDIYYVDNAGDVVIELANEGNDTVYASLSYTLTTNVENLIATGVWHSSLTGNDLDNRITGNASANTIDGGAGADIMTGGAGDDTYIVDNVGDTIIEWSNGGTDTVKASISYTLSTQVENLTLTGSANIDATGNWMNNILIGNSGNNVLDGGSGADRMDGGKGDDTYIIDNAGDTVIEWSNGGTDTVRSSISYILGSQVENLTLTSTTNINGTGNWMNNILIGNSGNNILNGGEGDDILEGSLGRDTLTGGSGKDIFVFRTVADSLYGNADTITDFTSSDRIDLSSLYDGTLKLLGTKGFTGNAGEVQLASVNGGIMVNIDVNGDAVADSQIMLANVAISSFTANSDWFIL